MMPKMLVYSLLFLSILIVEIVALAIHYTVETYEFKVFFLLLILITALAMGVFIAEGFLQQRRLMRSIQTEQTHQSTSQH